MFKLDTFAFLSKSRYIYYGRRTKAYNYFVKLSESSKNRSEREDLREIMAHNSIESDYANLVSAI